LGNHGIPKEVPGAVDVRNCFHSMEPMKIQRHNHTTWRLLDKQQALTGGSFLIGVAWGGGGEG
jgi:hypothetical protein